MNNNINPHNGRKKVKMTIQKNVTLNASVTVQIDNNETAIVNMYANIPQQGQPTINKTVVNVKGYIANKKACDADIATFEAEVYKALAGGQE